MLSLKKFSYKVNKKSAETSIFPTKTNTKRHFTFIFLIFSLKYFIFFIILQRDTKIAFHYISPKYKKQIINYEKNSISRHICRLRI